MTTIIGHQNISSRMLKAARLGSVRHAILVDFPDAEEREIQDVVSYWVEHTPPGGSAAQTKSRLVALGWPGHRTWNYVVMSRVAYDIGAHFELVEDEDAVRVVPAVLGVASGKRTPEQRAAAMEAERFIRESEEHAFRQLTTKLRQLTREEQETADRLARQERAELVTNRIRVRSTIISRDREREAQAERERERAESARQRQQNRERQNRDAQARVRAEDGAREEARLLREARRASQTAQTQELETRLRFGRQAREREEVRLRKEARERDRLAKTAEQKQLEARLRFERQAREREEVRLRKEAREHERRANAARAAAKTLEQKKARQRRKQETRARQELLAMQARQAKYEERQEKLRQKDAAADKRVTYREWAEREVLAIKQQIIDDRRAKALEEERAAARAARLKELEGAAYTDCRTRDFEEILYTDWETAHYRADLHLMSLESFNGDGCRRVYYDDLDIDDTEPFWHKVRRHRTWVTGSRPRYAGQGARMRHTPYWRRRRR